jgi:hypothetical protein
LCSIFQCWVSQVDFYEQIHLLTKTKIKQHKTKSHRF